MTGEERKLTTFPLLKRVPYPRKSVLSCAKLNIKEGCWKEGWSEVFQLMGSGLDLHQHFLCKLWRSGLWPRTSGVEVGVRGDWGWDGGVFSIVLGAVSGSVGWISAQLNHSERFDISVQRGLNNSRLENTNFSPSHEKVSFICEMCCSQTRCAGVDNTGIV